MNKSEDILKKRSDYIKEKVNKSKNTTKAIEKLSNELFLSEKTITRDLKK
jgi:DeoR/GlpR family transcriptional regulator of sugar metabolism